MTKLAKDLDSHFTKEIIQPGASGSIYNPSHFGGRDQEDRSSKPALGRLKKKREGGLAEWFKWQSTCLASVKS
jgi:hypothetical protein